MKEMAIKPSQQPLSTAESQGTAGKGREDASFSRFLKESINQVNQLQQEASRSAESLATGNGENIHETMIALEKAELSFKLMMQVRNKIVKAYEEVMRMQV